MFPLQSSPMLRQQSWAFMPPHLSVIGGRMLCRSSQPWARELPLARSIAGDVLTCEQPATVTREVSELSRSGSLDGASQPPLQLVNRG